MRSLSKRIIVYEEATFGRVCSALLETAGFTATSVALPESLSLSFADEVGLIILGYPAGEHLLESVGVAGVPVLVLAGHLDQDLMSRLEGCPTSFCMIKPIDYQKFLDLVRRVMDGAASDHRGYIIV